MKKLLLCLGLCLSVTTFAQKKEWLDPELNAINRAPARADYFAYPSREMAEQGVREESSNFLSLNGMWKFCLLYTSRMLLRMLLSNGGINGKISEILQL